VVTVAPRLWSPLHFLAALGSGQKNREGPPHEIVFEEDKKNRRVGSGIFPGADSDAPGNISKESGCKIGAAFWLHLHLRATLAKSTGKL